MQQARDRSTRTEPIQFLHGGTCDFQQQIGAHEGLFWRVDEARPCRFELAVVEPGADSCLMFHVDLMPMLGQNLHSGGGKTDP